MTVDVQVTDLGRGLHRVTLPLPWALDHVHCYALEDDDGWTLLDTGIDSPGTVRRWGEAHALLGSPRVRRLVLSHYHPDHLGASAALVELLGIEEVVQGRRDRQLTEQSWLDPTSGRRFEQHLRDHGMDDEFAGRAAEAEQATPVRPATPTLLVDDGDVLEIGGEAYRVLVLDGHADGMIGLHGQTSGRLLSADAILNEITPNVGRWEDSDPDPLGRFLATLRRIAELRPSIVHPGHRRPIEDAAARAAEIAGHHADRLAIAEQALRDGATSGRDVAEAIWGDRLGFHERRFAIVEAIAHVERLVCEGRAVETAPFRYTAG